MLGKHAVDVQLNQLLGLTIKEIEPILAVGGDSAEKVHGMLLASMEGGWN
jgi:hypothetical protein